MISFLISFDGNFRSFSSSINEKRKLSLTAQSIRKKPNQKKLELKQKNKFRNCIKIVSLLIQIKIFTIMSLHHQCSIGSGFPKTT